MAIISLQGNKVNTNGKLPELYSAAPDFVLVNKDLEDISLKNFKGQPKLISIVPSLDTPVCATSTKKLNELVQNHEHIATLIVSCDLPFAMSRFCAAEELDNVTTLSMMRSNQFAMDYGILIEDGPLAGITARAIVVLNSENDVVYTQLVEEISSEPDYDSLAKIFDTLK